MTEKSKIMSVSVTADMQEKLKLSAKIAGCTVSKLLRVLTECLPIVLNNGETSQKLEIPSLGDGASIKWLATGYKDGEIPVVLKIPSTLKGNKEAVREWMNTRVEALVAKLS